MEDKKIRENTDMTSLQKAWAVLFPCLLYYLTYNAAYLIFIFVQSVLQERMGESYGQWMTAHAATVTGMVSGICMILGILPLMSMLRRELAERNALAGSLQSVDRQELNKQVKDISATILLAFSASLGLNILLTLTGFADSSHTYQEVADRQYGVAFGIGIVLYGLVSPLAEEVVFRGVIYNRLRRFYGPVIGVVVSAIFFGAFHGNLVQGVYGACMGMLIAYVYERQGSFFFPVLFHAVANLAVYSIAHEQAVQEALFTPWGCGILLAVSVGCVYFVEKGRRDAIVR
ncbi:MAG: CPBP family intramembrane metalloprotease [Lachnospiraceae bacterium]|nr:CPBP family intramembrane metalloprotease [Lachnospiraceae bacterium]